MERLFEVAVSATIVVLVLGAANWVYRRIVNRTNEYGPDQEFLQMSTEEMIEGLEKVLNDPRASPETRAKAKRQLQTLRIR
jgi:hypothetical protein